MFRIEFCTEESVSAYVYLPPSGVRGSKDQYVWSIINNIQKYRFTLGDKGDIPVNGWWEQMNNSFQLLFTVRMNICEFRLSRWTSPSPCKHWAALYRHKYMHLRAPRARAHTPKCNLPFQYYIIFQPYESFTSPSSTLLGNRSNFCENVHEYKWDSLRVNWTACNILWF